MATAVLVAAGLIPAGAGAASLPFQDPNAQGFIGLCDRTGHAVTSGSILDAPFVWTAVSSTPAPDGYEHGKATLDVFQPRKGIEPGLWSGQMLTASSSYSNPAHPMAQATYGDNPLLFFTQAFPPLWDGLVQLRLYYSGVDLPNYRAHYPATVVRVKGQRWSVVSGGTVGCNLGKATSSEVGLPGGVPQASRLVQVNGPLLGAAGSGDSGLSAGVVAGAVAGVLLLLGAGTLMFIRRRRPTDAGAEGEPGVAT